MSIDNVDYSIRKFKKLREIQSRGLSGKLQFKKRISPNKIFKLFSEFISLSNAKKHVLSDYSKSEIALLNSLKYSLKYSFEFSEKWHHKFLCNSNDKEHFFPELNYVRNPPLQNLSLEEINNVRAIIIIMQNENCFHNFNPLLVSKIIAYNFQCVDEKSNNSLPNNRRILKEHFIKSDKNNSKFTPLISEVKLYLIKQYL